MGANIPIRRFEANTRGRDFIIGDLHGQLYLLKSLLDHVGFSAENDRLFSVGDLIDRGEDSAGCLALLREPWFHAVMGNHEQMLIDFLHVKQGNVSRFGVDVRETNHPFIQNGGNWWYQSDIARIFLASDILDDQSTMPCIITVGEGANRFNIVHAELDSGHRSSQATTDELIDKDCLIAPDFIHGFGYGLIEDQLVWSRSFRRNNDFLGHLARVRPGLSITYCGHSILPRPADSIRMIESHFNLDAGAYKTAQKKAEGLFGLMMTEHTSGCDSVSGFFVSEGRTTGKISVDPFSIDTPREVFSKSPILR